MIDPMATAKAHSDADLLGYLDEMLSPDRMAALEGDLRADEALRLRLAALSRRRDEGVHSVGEIWRRSRLSCPTRGQLGGYLLGTLPAALADYVEFHVRSVGCRICAANLHDLERSARSGGESGARRRRFFESSAGQLRDMRSRGG
jgi:anti-sigma factor RsiW